MMTGADAFHATTYRQPVGPGEMTIPAIRGVGGSLLYFLEPGLSNWDVDFVPVPSAGEGGFLSRIDHISQSLRFEELLSWEHVSALMTQP
jgi:4-hydroxyphenylpyruvate dioxygenase